MLPVIELIIFGKTTSASSVATGPFLLLTDGVSKLLLANSTDHLLITGTNPAGAFVPTFELLGF